MCTSSTRLSSTIIKVYITFTSNLTIKKSTILTLLTYFIRMPHKNNETLVEYLLIQNRTDRFSSKLLDIIFQCLDSTIYINIYKFLYTHFTYVISHTKACLFIITFLNIYVHFYYVYVQNYAVTRRYTNFASAIPLIRIAIRWIMQLCKNLPLIII